MTYALPDEPRGAVRPDLAVGAVWPLLTLMIVGPLIGFAWLAFNSWALGCRHARRHTVIAVLTVPALGLATILIASLAKFVAPPDHVDLVARLMLVLTQSMALVLAFWMMWDQTDAEEWRKTFGEPLRNGALAFLAFLVMRILIAGKVPVLIYVFAFWAPA